jgi:hypothetical protein
MLQRSAAKSAEAEERPREPTKSAVQVVPEPLADSSGEAAANRDSGIRGHAQLGYVDDGYVGEEEITKTASLRELEERSIASSPRPVQLTPVPRTREEMGDDELQVDEGELFEEDERR